MDKDLGNCNCIKLMWEKRTLNRKDGEPQNMPPPPIHPPTFAIDHIIKEHSTSQSWYLGL